MARFAPVLRAHALALATLAAVACSSTTEKPPETPDPNATAAKDLAPADTTAGPDAKDANPAPTAASTAKLSNDQNSIPDDYYLTAGDCDVLGKQYGHAAKADQAATLSSKLSEAKRAQALEAIEKVVTKLEDKWIAGCQNSLVGKVADPKNLKCASGAQTVKAFDVCLNGESTGPAQPGTGQKKKK